MLFQGFPSTYNIEILNSFKPELQLKVTESVIKRFLLIYFLTHLKGFKLAITLFLAFKKIETEVKANNNTFFSNIKVETIINESDIDDVFKSIYAKIISNIHKSLGKGSSSIND